MPETPAQKVKNLLQSRPNQWVMGLTLEEMAKEWKEKGSIVTRRARELVQKTKRVKGVEVPNSAYDPTIEAKTFPHKNAKGKNVKVVAYRYVPPEKIVVIPKEIYENAPGHPYLTSKKPQSLFPPVERKPDYTKI